MCHSEKAGLLNQYFATIGTKPRASDQPCPPVGSNRRLVAVESNRKLVHCSSRSRRKEQCTELYNLLG